LLDVFADIADGYDGSYETPRGAHVDRLELTGLGPALG